MDLKDKVPQFKLWEKLVFFFPVQLLFVHLKKNLLLLTFWLLLFALISRSIGLKYGVPYLFLFPEYLGQVNFLSHLIVGLTTGAFIMSFNLSSYVVNGFRFPFLATLSRPFIKYCQNNFIIPLAYSITYIIALAFFQSNFEGLVFSQILINVLGFLLGNLLFIGLTGLYFAATNKNLFSFSKGSNNTVHDQYINPVSDLFSNQKKWERTHGAGKKEWKVTTYISQFGSIKLARNSSHYKKNTLEKVFAQNRINASLFQASVLVALFIMGLYNDNKWLMIPAASSILLFFTMLIMLASAFYSWFKGWTSVVILALLVSLNFLSTKSPLVYKNQAYGLNYNVEKVEYSQANIATHQKNYQNLYLDVENGLEMLQNWKSKTGEEKPVAVFLNVPGGGLRSAMWTIQSIGKANEISNGELWDNLLLISGSSGGMVGAAYLREYYWRKECRASSITLDSILDDISKDKLNPVAASAVLNDVFFRFKTFEYDGKQYTKDRALAFENKLDLDTRGWLNRRLKDYQHLEHKAEMPMLLLAPTISDDGRKLLISSQPISYLCQNFGEDQLNENIEFSRFFKNQESENLNFITALRMSATFPYVFPSANLPTNPGVEILDAGIRDNYGISNTLKFMYFFKDWLAANTSQILIIQVRDQEKIRDINANKQPSILEGITQPFGTFYTTILDVQDYQMDDQIRMARGWYGGKIEVVEYVLNRSEINPISLSWHLTQREKERIIDAAETDYNQIEFIRTKTLLKH